MITIGSITASVRAFRGWDYPQFGSVVAVLHDGASVDNEVLQSGSVLRQRAVITGHTIEVGDVTVLSGYNASKEMVDFEDDELLDSRTVVVTDFRVDRSIPFLFQYTIELIDMSDMAGSGS